MADNLVPRFILEQHKYGDSQGTFQAATLFVDLSGYTPITAALMLYQKDGAEALAEALHTVFAPLVRIVDEHGGLIPLFAGDGYTAIFPAEVDETDPASSVPKQSAALHAVECAFAIHQWLAHGGRPVQTRYGDFQIDATIGLSFGKVQWGIPESGRFHTYYFRGQAIDACAKSEHMAQEGEIVADIPALAVLGPHVTTAPLNSASYYKITGQSQPAPQPASLARLREWIQPIFEGQLTGMFLIHGEAFCQPRNLVNVILSRSSTTDSQMHRIR